MLQSHPYQFQWERSITGSDSDWSHIQQHRRRPFKVRWEVEKMGKRTHLFQSKSRRIVPEAFPSIYIFLVNAKLKETFWLDPAAFTWEFSTLAMPSLWWGLKVITDFNFHKEMSARMWLYPSLDSQTFEYRVPLLEGWELSNSFQSFWPWSQPECGECLEDLSALIKLVIRVYKPVGTLIAETFAIAEILCQFT